jgi:hypothetical protein
MEHGWWQSHIYFDPRMDNENGKAGRHCGSNQNCGNGKTQSDHFLAFCPALLF